MVICSVDGYLDHFPFGAIKSELDIHPPFLLLWIYWFPDPRGETAESQVRRLFNLEKGARWGGRLSSSHRRLTGLIAPHLLSVLPICSTSVIVVGGKYYLVALICVPRMVTNDMSSFCVLIDHLGVSLCDVSVQAPGAVLRICGM